MKKMFLFFAFAMAVFFSNLCFADPSNVPPAQGTAATGPFAPISTRIISDPLYLPLKGQFYGSTEYEFYRYRNAEVGSTGEVGATKTNDNALTQSFAYGITDNFAIGLYETYEYDRDYDTVNSVNYRSMGVSNPEFGATYRILDQKAYPLDLDLFSLYTPNMIKARFASDTKMGNIVVGRQVLDLGGDIGREMKNFTIEAFVNAEYLGEERYEDLSGDQKNKYKYRWDYTYGINTQTRITDRFSTNLGFSYTDSPDNGKGVDLSTGEQNIHVPADYWTLGVSLNYQIIPNKLVGSLLYTYYIYSNSKYLFPTDPEFNTTSTKASEQGFGFQLSYLF